MILLNIWGMPKQKKAPKKKKEPKFTTWSSEELDFIKKYYAVESIDFISKKLGRTRSATIAQAHRLRSKGELDFSLLPTGDDSDVSFLIKSYRSKSVAEIAKELDRTEKSIHSMIGKLVKGGSLKVKSKMWTEEEAQFLKDHVSKLSMSELEIALNTSEKIIKSKLQRMGIKRKHWWKCKVGNINKKK